MSIPPVRICALLLAALLLCAPLSWASELHTLRLLTEEGPPFNFLGKDGPQGFTVDLVRELLARTGTSGEISFLPWARAYDTALTEPDTVLFTISRTPERESLFRWVGPIMTLRWGLYALAESKIRVSSLEDARLLAGIATYRADVREAYLRNLCFANLYPAASFGNSVRMMLDGHVAAVIADGIGLFHYLKQEDIPTDSVEKIFTFKTIDLYIAFSRATDPELPARWQQALDALQRDGTYRRIHAHWLPPETLPTFDALPAMQ
ncbi:MAG: substrate-binding periplasmic protein [Desulfovibrio sp.]